MNPSLFFANALGPLASGPSDGGSVLADPRFLGQDAGDFRLAPGSPAVNAGFDSGLDVNGPAAGDFNGSGPDLGGRESPY